MFDKTVIMLPIDQVTVQENPFKDLDKPMFDKLVKSIKAHGILEPLHVKRDNGRDLFFMILDKNRYFCESTFGDKMIIRRITNNE